ncbi:MAG: M23 family metallopeptidase [Deltaproteobacteria bacterium]|nr:M23 family metallopeptidase [Deltaproteobacteria bacterium]
MTARKVHLSAAAIFVVLVGLTFPSAVARALTFRLTWDPSIVRPGAVVPMIVKSPVPLTRVEAVVSGERFPLIRTSTGNYVALVGIDLGMDAPVNRVEFFLYMKGRAAPYRMVGDLKVQSRKFGSQSLSLPAGMVDLAGNTLERVRKDSGRLRSVLAERVEKRYWEKPFVLPVSGRISTRFGTRRILNGKPRSPHSGIDIAAPRGTPIAAANRGEVILAADLFLSGNTVVIDHGWGLLTIYAHMDSISVREHRLVDRGDILGRVGSSGRATGPHLHFGVFIRGAKVDPEQLLDLTFPLL